MTDASDIAAARAQVAAGSRDPAVWNALAAHLADSGDIAGAMHLLEQVRGFAPDDPQTLVNLGSLYRIAGRLRDAVLACDAAIRAAPGATQGWLERAYVLASGGSMAGARESYQRVLALDPAHAAAHAGLASLDARDGAGEAARDHATRALAADPGNAMAAGALATVLLEAGEAAQARAVIEPVLARLPGAGADSALLHNLHGDALARLGEADAAFAAYARSNADFLATHAAVATGRPSQRGLIDRITAAIPVMDPARWPPHAAPARAPHLFLGGYPRSGNTLAENILASIPGVAALEERPTLAAADQAFLAPEDGLARLAALDDAALDPFRAAYWDHVRGAGADPVAPFVDMDPLKSLRLPLIARLFPQARVVLVRRDPRDVVWSCFHTHFALSNAALEFATLEGTARHYDAVMRLTEAALAHLPLNVFVLDYHRLVSDFAASTQALCAFAGLPWSEDLLRFDRTAKARGVSTASAGQVRRGLYDGRRQWEPFAHHLEPVMPILAPWIGRFGYL